MRTIVLLYFILFFCSCQKRLQLIKTDSCSRYYKELSINWNIDANGVYGFQDNGEYWEVEKCLALTKEDCLIGLGKNEIISLLGKPTKEFVFRQNGATFDMYVYCTNKDCIEPPKLYGGFNISLSFDENGKLNTISTSPVVTTGVLQDH